MPRKNCVSAAAPGLPEGSPVHDLNNALDELAAHGDMLDLIRMAVIVLPDDKRGPLLTGFDQLQGLAANARESITWAKEALA